MYASSSSCDSKRACACAPKASAADARVQKIARRPEAVCLLPVLNTSARRPASKAALPVPPAPDPPAPLPRTPVCDWRRPRSGCRGAASALAERPHPPPDRPPIFPPATPACFAYCNTDIYTAFRLAIEDLRIFEDPALQAKMLAGSVGWELAPPPLAGPRPRAPAIGSTPLSMNLKTKILQTPWSGSFFTTLSSDICT